NIERTVERKTGRPLHRWDREAFIAECRKEIEAIGNGLLELAVRVGMSADFAHVYYTDSDEYRAFSQAIFLELWPKGLFYRGERPTFWCPVCETPLAEADIEYEDRGDRLPERPESRRCPREGDRRAPGPRRPRQGRADSAPDADLLAVPEPDRVHLLGRVVSEAARIPRGSEAPRARDGIPSAAASAAAPRLDGKPDDRLADLQASVLSHRDPTLVLQEVRRDARATSREILPTVEGTCTVLEVPEMWIQRVSGRGPRLRHLDGLECVEPLPHAISVRFGILQGELSSVLTVPRPRDR